MSGDAFLVDAIAFRRNKDWQRDVGQRNGDRGRRHSRPCLRRRGYPALHRLQYGLVIDFVGMDKENPARLEHFSQNSPIRLTPCANAYSQIR